MKRSTVTARPAPFFLGEHRALDFLNTIATPWDEPIEWLESGRDLLDWLVQAGLVPASGARGFRRTARDTELDAVARQARELREWFRGFVCACAGKPLTPAAALRLERLNELLARDDAYGRLVPVRAAKRRSRPGPVVEWRWERRWRTPDALLLPLAVTIGDFVCRADFRYVRRCERCTLWFLDVSKGHGRRWCSMAVCGNRAKAAARRVRGLG